MERPRRPAPGIAFEDVLRRNLTSPEFRAAYEREGLIHEVALAVRRLREEAGMTQAQLAGAVGTAQSVIARLEGGRDQRVPRFDLLDRIAAAVGRRCKIVFSRAEDSSPLVEITPDT